MLEPPYGLTGKVLATCFLVFMLKDIMNCAQFILKDEDEVLFS